jgi:hypothetical protein
LQARAGELDDREAVLVVMPALSIAVGRWLAGPTPKALARRSAAEQSK